MILGLSRVRILVTREAWVLDEEELVAESEDELEEELEDELVEELEEKVDPVEVEETPTASCCLSALCTAVVMDGVRVVMIFCTRKVTWLWETSWLELTLDVVRLELRELDELDELEELAELAELDAREAAIEASI